jgi:hypothetical protein
VCVEPESTRATSRAVDGDVQLHRVADVDAGEGMEGDAQILCHVLFIHVIVELDQEHPLGDALVVGGVFLWAVIALPVGVFGL